MSVGLRVEVRSAELEARLQKFMAGLSDRRELHELIGARETELTRNHLVAVAQSRHATAQRLGATPTGFWGQGAEKTTFTVDEKGATVSIRQPGVGRAFHDVTIEPGAGKKYLAIAAIAEAYGKLPRTVPDLTAMIRWKDGQRRAVALAKVSGKGKERTETAWYWLVKSVRQKQDRTLLPSDEQYRLQALAAVRDYIGKRWPGSVSGR
jgi:hypothetical protein